MSLAGYYGKDSNNCSFSGIIKDLLSDSSFLRSDKYFVYKILSLPQGMELTDKIRHDAYLKFCSETAGIKLASAPTMKRWFGLNGYTAPGREQIYQAAFAMGISGREVEEIFTYGLHEPGVLFNDYHEVIYLYCLENKLKWEDAMQMLDKFESPFDAMTEFSHTCNTNRIKQQYELKKYGTAEEFMKWMVMNAASFKGYSKTALNYLNKYSLLIIKYIRMDAAESLEHLLRETDFYLWKKRRKFLVQKSHKELVQKYIGRLKRRKQHMSEDLFDNIIELNRIAYSKNPYNGRILSELFMHSSHSAVLGSFTVKHLSDLLNIPLQAERAMRAEKAVYELDRMPQGSSCPSWICDFIAEYTKGKVTAEKKEDAVKWLSHFRTEHHRRCKMVQRKDILPMVLYVSQRRYNDNISKLSYNYQAEDAKKAFEELANTTLSACGMVPLNTGFQLDALLLACFQPEEMYTYSDILDVIGELCK